MEGKNDQGKEEEDEDERKGEIGREGKNWGGSCSIVQDRGRQESRVKSVITDRLEWIGLTMTLTDYLNI